jgi:NitT/TauT family transport system permease protein
MMPDVEGSIAEAGPPGDGLVPAAAVQDTAASAATRTGVRDRAGGGLSRAVTDWAVRLVIIAIALVLWQLMSGRVLPTYAVSKPTDVASTLATTLTSRSGWTDIETTLQEFLIGFALGAVTGLALGIVLGTLRSTGRILEPLIAAVNGIPKIALAPIFILFFGLGIWSKIAIAALGVGFVMFYNVFLGMRSVPVPLVNVIRMMDAKPVHVLRYVIGPSLAQPILAGLKAGGPLAMLGVIAGEFVASFQGVGHELQQAASVLDASGVFAALVILVIMQLLINSLLTLFDAAVTRWLGMERH